MNPHLLRITSTTTTTATSSGTVADSSSTVAILCSQSPHRSCSSLSVQHQALNSDCLSSAGIDDLNPLLHCDCICSFRPLES